MTMPADQNPGLTQKRSLPPTAPPVNFQNRQAQASAPARSQPQPQNPPPPLPAAPSGPATTQVRPTNKPGFGVVVGVSGESPIPHTGEGEDAVLGSLLLDRETITKVIPILTPKDFFNPEKAAIYQAMLDLYGQRTPGDLITLRDELRRRDLLGDGENQVKPAYLIALMRTTSSPVHVEHYAKIVKHYSLMRRLIEVGTEITAIGFDEQSKPETKIKELDNLHRKTLAWWNKDKKDQAVVWHADTFDLLKDLDVKPGAPAPIILKTGFACYDGQRPVVSASDPWGSAGKGSLIALEPGSLTTIAAAPGNGKTSGIEGIFEYNAENGLVGHEVICHNENPTKRMLWRRYARRLGIPFWKFREKCLSSDDMDRLVKDAAIVDAWPGKIHFVHCPKWDGGKLVQELQRMNERLLGTTGVGIGLVAWDYIQKAGVPEGFGQKYLPTDEAVINYNITQFADFAEQLGIPAIIASQLKKDGYTEKNKRPTIGDIKGSGAFMERSQQVLAYYVDDAVAEWLCFKNNADARNWKMSMNFTGERFRFDEIPGATVEPI
jgi:replicative DNA helicase